LRNIPKKIIKIILIIVVFIASTQLVLMQWKLNFLFPQVQSYFATTHSLDAKLVGDIKIESFLLPKIAITNLELQEQNNDYKLSIPKVQININLLNLLNKQNPLDFNNIAFYNPKIKVRSKIHSNLKELKQIFAKQLENNVSSNISIINGTLKFVNNDSSATTHQLDNFNLSYRNAYGKDMSLETSFNTNEDRYSLSLEANDMQKEFNPKSLSVSFKHNLLHLQTALKKDSASGNLVGKTNIHFDSNNNNKSSDIKKFIHQENFKSVEANTELSQQSLKVDNFATTSENVKNIKGNAVYYLENNTLDIGLAIDELNLDAIMSQISNPKEQNNFTAMDFLDFLTKKVNMNISKFITTSVNLGINKLIYKQGNINNLMLDFSTWSSNTPHQSKLLANNLSMTLPGDSKFSAYGVLYDGVIPTFKGQISLISSQPKDFLLWAYKDGFTNTNTIYNSPTIAQFGVVLMPHVLQLHDIQMASQNSKVLAEVLTLNYPNGNNLQCYTNVLADNVDLDSFNLSNKFDDLIYLLYNSDFSNTGKEFSEKTADFSFLRDQKGSKNFYIEANNLVFKKESFDNVVVDIDANKNYLKLDNLKFNHGLCNHTGKIKLTTSDIKPKLDVDLNFSKFDSKFLDIILPTEEDLKAHYQEDISKAEGDKQKSAVSDINFYGINNFTGNFKINIDQLQMQDTELENLNLTCALADGGVNVSNFSAKGFNGNIKANGSISTSRPIFGMQFGIGLNNIDPSLLLSYLTNTDNNSGYLSASGTLSTKGMTRADFINNLNGNFQIQAKDINHNGFDLVELVNLAQLNTTYDEKMKQLDYYSKYGNTNFSNVSGALVMTNGIVNLSNITLVNPKANSSLNLVYSFLDHSLSANSKFAFLPKANATPIVINVNGSGDISNLQMNIDTSLLEQYLRSQTPPPTPAPAKSP
jgi:hypothetical protein